ncbi:aspartyl/glutamyl-tRNA amidotransferase subunit A [Candidatus Uhrbacteria bacterium RIFOXYB12_FULL_58_10]|nr:MAG: aspartyl/glutamyl-tRNA amidotransferase subunit A [Candidatus Uhrbacteria bacterium RIFOXYB12_FULL_58_10]OGL99969.1 MAG: aspartyl/glutamyl-tRNA amidotransferase subunit A [Candidatus Uhrbacteria bacterium RIFOXYC12_FULL_57_11]
MDTAIEMARDVREGKRSSEEIVQECLDRIEGGNEKLNALLGTFDDALERARGIDERRTAGEDVGPLGGVPVILKDNMLVKGERCTAGSRILENYDAPYDATVTKRLRAAGAVLIGRSNCDEFAMGSSTENSHYGPTRNPWDTDRVPGGSSGGSAVAVATGFAPLAFGSDTGGSIRQPASLCGVVGLKPTYGRVSRHGLVALASSLDQIGPFARTVEDAALALEVIQGDDPLDATTVAGADASIPELLERDVKGMRVGVPKEYFLEGMDEDVRRTVMDAIAVYEKAGANIVEISLPNAPYALASYYVVMPSEACSNLGRFDGIRFGYSSEGSTLLETYERSRGEGFGPEVRRRIMLGTFALSKGYADAFYRKALKARTLIKRDFDDAFKDVDVIATPTSPSVAWPIGEKFNDPLAMYLADIYTVSANMATIPGMSIPCGFVNELPVGLQLLGRTFDEYALFRAGAYYQSVTDWHTRTP